MPRPLTDLQAMLAAMDPRPHEGVYVYAVLPRGEVPPGMNPVATMREAEGLTVILPEAEARAHHLEPRFRAAWITLEVPSALEAVGLTAAFAGALARAGLSCNVVAGTHHDHLFVPVAQRDAALAALRALQREARAHPDLE